MLGETLCTGNIFFAHIRKDCISRNSRSYCKYFYRAARLAMIYVNDLSYPRMYLLTCRSKTFTFSYFFNYSAFFFSLKHLIAIRLEFHAQICQRRKGYDDIGIFLNEFLFSRGNSKADYNLAIQNLLLHLPNPETCVINLFLTKIHRYTV